MALQPAYGMNPTNLQPVGAVGGLGAGIGGAYGGGYVGGIVGGLVSPANATTAYNNNGYNGGVYNNGYATNGGVQYDPASLLASIAPIGTALIVATTMEGSYNRNNPIVFDLGIQDTSGAIVSDGQGEHIIFNIPGKYYLEFFAIGTTVGQSSVTAVFSSTSIPTTLKVLYSRTVSTIPGRPQSITNSSILVANAGTTLSVKVYIEGSSDNVTIAAGAKLLIHGL